MSDRQTRSGFAAIIGATNAGKSTLMNYLVGTKVSIVTHKVQTTRFPVRGVVMHEDTQIVLVDTPGIFAPKRRFDRAMVQSAWDGAGAADITLHLVDAEAWVAVQSEKATPAQKRSVDDDLRIIEALTAGPRPLVCVFNKLDTFDHSEILPLIEQFKEHDVYDDFLLISAANGEGVDALKSVVASHMPVGEFLYPEDQAADLPLRLLAAEITREKLMLRLHQELPYQLTVETENWEERKDGSVKIDQAILVGRDNHKGMVLGKSGQGIRAIGTAARRELEELMDRKVHLYLFVKVDEKWSERRTNFEPLGLNFDA